ncbi:Importin-7 [Heterocephalus glaber]|uniref:Importin-7 n=1 Tax=Heterocephalus glaber TaxID=10181 RepID=G5AVG8_HETGA|nr:Importin-7 [Heterocephalus glaber]
MCYTDADEELWQEDPYEYILMKFDVFEDFISPTTAAQTLLFTACSKRKEVLQKTMGFCYQILKEPNADPRKKDGALHMIGSLAEILLKKKIYKDQLEYMLQNHVFPLFSSELGYMRARACWVLHYFCDVKFKSDQNQQTALELTRRCLIDDREVPGSCHCTPDVAATAPVFEVFQQDGFDYFTNIMPLLHNYATVDTDTLLSDTKYLEMIYSMCKKVLTGVAGEDAECHAAKLLEVIILQCKGCGIDQCIPLFMEAALGRLTREVKTSELQTMCLQDAITALYYNPHLLLNTLGNLHFPNNVEPVTIHFITQWLNDVDCFSGLHDRKMCVLGLCALIDMEQIPQVLNQVSGQILPAFIFSFNGLKRAYGCHAEPENDSDNDNEAEDDNETEELGSDEDDINADGQAYLEILAKQAGEDVDGEAWGEDDAEEAALAGYSTIIDDEDNPADEYQIFKAIFQTIQNNNPVWHQALTHGLNEEQRKQLQDTATLADQRREAHESKMIEKHGGYKFSAPVVPSSFNFGGSTPGIN